MVLWFFPPFFLSPGERLMEIREVKSHHIDGRESALGTNRVGQRFQNSQPNGTSCKIWMVVRNGGNEIATANIDPSAACPSLTFTHPRDEEASKH